MIAEIKKKKTQKHCEHHCMSNLQELKDNKCLLNFDSFLNLSEASEFKWFCGQRILNSFVCLQLY